MKKCIAQTKYFSDPSFTPVLVTFWNYITYLCNTYYAKCSSRIEIKSKADSISELKKR